MSAPIYRHATQLAWLFALAAEHDMPAPRYVRTANDDWSHCPNLDLTFESLADLTAWATWSEASIEDYIGTEGFVGYHFEAAINDVPVACTYFTDVREQVSA